MSTGPGSDLLSKPVEQTGTTEGELRTLFYLGMAFGSLVMLMQVQEDPSPLRPVFLAAFFFLCIGSLGGFFYSLIHKDPMSTRDSVTQRQLGRRKLRSPGRFRRDGEGH